MSIGIEPGEGTIRVLLLEEDIEAISAGFHLYRQLTPGLVHLGPCAICQDFTAEFYTMHCVASQMLNKLCLHLATIVNVFEHLSHLVYLISTALHFKLLNEVLLVFP